MNRLLLGEALQRLRAEGLRPLVPGAVPVNDGCIAFGQAAQAGIQQMGDCQIKDGVTEKFKPFVMIRREATVRQSLTQKRRLGKRVLQALLQRQKAIGHVTWSARCISGSRRRARLNEFHAGTRS